jgi:hypothetical protein
VNEATNSEERGVALNNRGLIEKDMGLTAKALEKYEEYERITGESAKLHKDGIKEWLEGFKD